MACCCKNVKKYFTNIVDDFLLLAYNIIEMKEVVKMRFDDLFEQRSLVALKLKDCIRDRGYTTVSFAKKADISRTTLDKLLNGSINNKTMILLHYQRRCHPRGG